MKKLLLATAASMLFASPAFASGIGTISDSDHDNNGIHTIGYLALTGSNGRFSLSGETPLIVAR